MAEAVINPKDMSNDELREYLLLLVQHVKTYCQVPFYALGVIKEAAERIG